LVRCRAIVLQHRTLIPKCNSCIELTSEQMVKLEEKQYESLLKEDLACFHCNHVSKNMPQLKQHIEEEWNKLAERERTRADRKRKLEERKDRKKTEELAEGEEQEEEEVLAKKAKIDED